jgi:uncharacterized delta-60 repeat protein
VISSNSPSQFRPLTVSPQRDGRILLVGAVGGYAYFGGGPSQIALLRLLPDGSRDRSFGTNGLVVWNPPWRTAAEWTEPVSALRRPDGRVLVAATVGDPRSQGSPGWSPRLVLVRFQPGGSLDHSFGEGGFAELDPGDRCFGSWALLADGRLASVVPRGEGGLIPYPPPPVPWWLCTFSPDGASSAPLHPTGPVPLGLDPVTRLIELVPIRDGGLLMIGETDVRRIRPDGSLDATYGRKCSQPPLRVATRGGVATPDGARS